MLVWLLYVLLGTAPEKLIRHLCFWIEVEEGTWLEGAVLGRWKCLTETNRLSFFWVLDHGKVEEIGKENEVDKTTC